MSNNFPKKYDPNIEDEINNKRKENDIFNNEKIKEIKGQEFDGKFVVPMPPPNVTGVLHLGHSLMLTIEDVMIRHARMKNKEAIWIPGTDHAGIATQVVVEQELEKEKLTKYDLGRDKFIERVWERARNSRSTILSQIDKMGASCDRSREQFTMSERLSRAVRKSFNNLYYKGKIYKGNYIVNWDPKSQTVVSDIEVDYEEEDTKLYYIRYFIEGKGDNIQVATVRPETIFGDVAIAVNPKDKRYKKFIGKNVLIPIVNRPIPVISDENVDMEFGTGALKITPTHDQHDFEIGKKHDLPLDHFSIDKKGCFTDLAGELIGFHYEEVFDNLIQQLDEIGNIEKIENYTTSIPYSDRTKARIQPMLSQQRFMDVDEAAKVGINYVENEDINLYPERFKKDFYNRLGNIKPRCISRQLWRGHRIPVWYGPNGELNVFDEDNVLNENDNRENSILSMIIFNLISDYKLSNPFNVEELINVLNMQSITPNEGKIYQTYLNTYRVKFKDDENKLNEIDTLEEILEVSINVEKIVSEGNKLIEIIENSKNIKEEGDKYKFEFICKHTGELTVKQDEDILDTWFSSGLWPFSILGRPENTTDLQSYYPTTILETGHDIIFFRVARMIMIGYENLNEKPFDNIFLHGMVRDENGEKMSKSKGNIIDPLEMINKYGADSLRLAIILGVTPGNDIKISVDKIEYYQRFVNKLWNATRYINMKLIQTMGEISDLNYGLIKEDIQSNYNKLNDFDKWIINKINELCEFSEKQQKKFLYGELGQEIIKVAWHDLCDRYIEVSKLDSSEYTDKVLLYAIGTILKFLHPYAPFVTEKLRELMNFEGFITISNYPEILNVGEINYKVNFLMDIISELRNLKNQTGTKPHEKVEISIKTNSNMKEFIKQYETIINNLINVESINYLGENEDIGKDFEVAVIVDSKVGVKGIKQTSTNDRLKELHEQLEEEQQFLQSIRNLISSSGFQEKAPESVKKEKQQKMNEVKTKIENIEDEINKLKMK